ncbi:OmpA family protein [Paracoccus sp. TK19116]|uniref:OmpA family protein n=1 Tax=Paracoccus albicereus TaxID=2922394 RepID=A0ABT1MR02_9RHOB|nr:OmpA family protein [Paracoccus albicereus]MCQ0970735.1 OmpA family protein [Paracoccus albicereus]
MRRIIKNSTAIVTALAVLAPQATLAEMRIRNEVAAENGPIRAERNPGLADTLNAELATGLTVDGLLCADGSERPCADDVWLMTPGGVTVQVAENGDMIVAPRDQQQDRLAQADVPAADGEIVPPPAPEAAEPSAAEASAETMAETEPMREAAPEDAPAADTASAPEEPVSDAPAAEAAPDALAEQAAEAEPAEPAAPMTEQTADEAPAPAALETQAEAAPMNDQPADAPAAEAASEGESPSADDLAAELERAQAEADAQAQAEAATDQQPAPEPAASAAADTAANAPVEADTGALIMSDSQIARQRIAPQQIMAQRLQAEVAAGLTMDDLTCETGAAKPCAEGVGYLTPGGIIVETDGTGRIMLAERERQQNRIAENGEVTARAPEEGTASTAASEEAASETTAAVAAALQEGAQASSDNVVEEEVTEANTRSSAEDFETSLRNALSGAAAQQNTNRAAESDDDDSGSDLAKALILGLGAVAVGQVLNNNRQVALATPDRVVVQRADGSQEIVKDEVALLRQPGSTVTTENFDDGSSRTIVTRSDGSKVVTIRDANLRVLRRTLISADGQTTQLIDDTAQVEPVNVSDLPPAAKPVASSGNMDEEALRRALQQEAQINRTFTLNQIRNIPEVRALVAPVNIDAITFDTGSAAIKPDQAQQLATLGRVIQDAVEANPREIFMIEGHTDTVGADAMNLALSDRRAESVALALSEYFDVPPENLVVQGYGEQFLKIRAQGDIRENRRASVRRITDLMRTAAN